VLGNDAVPAELAAIVERTRSFVGEVCIPAEDRFTGDEPDPGAHDDGAARRRRLGDRRRQAVHLRRGRRGVCHRHGADVPGQGLIADSVIDLEASHSLIRWAAEALDAGQAGRHETSVAKVFVAEAVFRVVGRAVQLTGGDGVMHDLPLARFLADVRPFRIYDGPSETHRWAIARRAARVRAAEREQQR
jgi:alkylation response protein AidB-like acyl-CoA dehydrogenase